MTHAVSRHELLKALSQSDFRLLGLNRIAYIRPAQLDSAQIGWALHAADGTVLSIQNHFEDAALIARSNDLAPVTVH